MDSPKFHGFSKNKSVNGVQLVCTSKAIGDHSGEEFSLLWLTQVPDLYGFIVENCSQAIILNTGDLIRSLSRLLCAFTHKLQVGPHKLQVWTP
jgi:hypothetical protein